MYKFATFETTFIKCWTVTPNNFFGQDTKEKLCHVTVRHFSAMKFSRIKPNWYWSNLWLSITNISEQKRTPIWWTLILGHCLQLWTSLRIFSQFWASFLSLWVKDYEMWIVTRFHINLTEKKRSKPNSKMCCAKWICHLKLIFIAKIKVKI